MKGPSEWLRSPRARKVGIWAGALLVLWAVFGFLVLPPLVRPVVERKFSEALHRKATLRGLAINPFALSVTLKGLDVKDRDGTSPFFSFESLYLNAETASIFRGGPVLSAVALVKPSLTLVRNADETYNVQDLLDEAKKPKPPDEKPLRFSLNNIRLTGGSVDFDDRPAKTRHTVRDLSIGIPFLSNIPSKVEITTEPLFEAKVNGAAFALHGKSRPFSGTRDSALDLVLSDVDLPHYLAYIPSDRPAKLTSALLDTNLVFTFSQPPSGKASLVVSGRAALRKVAFTLESRPLLTWERFEADADAIDVFGGSAKIRSLKLVAPELWVRRDTLGEHNVARALAAPGARKSPPKKGKAGEAETPPPGSSGFAVDVAEAAIERGIVHYDNFAFHPEFHGVFSEVTASMKGFTTRPAVPAALVVSMKSDAGETFRSDGTVSMDPADVAGTFSVESSPLKRYTMFVGEFVPIAMDDGMLSLKTGYRYTTGKDANTVLKDLSATIVAPRLRKLSEKVPFFTAASLETSGTALDVAKHVVAVGEFTGTKGVLTVIREKDGRADLMELASKPTPTPAPDAPAAAPAPAAPEASGPSWEFSMKKLQLAGWTVKVDDRSWDHDARYALTKTDLVLENVSTAKGSKGALDVAFGVDGKGRASAKGPVGLKPMFADLRIGVKGIDLVPLEAYVLPNLRLSLAKGTVNAGGRLAIREDDAGKASVVWTGDTVVADVLAVDEATKLDFLKWETFSATGVKAGYNPLFFEAKQLAAAGLSCDVTIAADGTVNLRKVVGAPAPKADEDEKPAGDASAGSAPAPTPSPTPTPAPTPAPSPVPAGKTDPRLRMPVKIDEITLQGGRIGLADHFVKPNYSATLGDLGGRVTGLSSQEGTVATLDLRGSLANHSPLQISGTINPLAVATYADVKGSFRDLDLPAFTPYSGTYAGYTIAKGTLTMEVVYKVVNRKLEASNRFLVNEFDFGDKVESEHATKLPVKFAVSLLKDKDGVIDLDLPIEGSLDDPKFRIGKVIWQILGNIVSKAVSAPFSLLGKLFGGKGEELSYVEFPDGIATLDEAGRQKLDALAKALNNRPALKVQATGRFGAGDAEGLRAVRVERRIKAQKLADLAKKGTAPGSVDDVVVEAAEREAYLKKAYKKADFPKPRTALGFQKDLPADEMEKLLLTNERVADDDLRQLALARSNTVKDYLAGTGGVDAARVFVLEPGAQAAAPKEKMRGSRVDFTLK
jgi:hypothetical protein